MASASNVWHQSCICFESSYLHLSAPHEFISSKDSCLISLITYHPCLKHQYAGEMFETAQQKVPCRWKGAASDVFLLEAVRLMESKGYLLGNIDVTIIAERPKISPHKQNILDNLYNLLKAPAETINLKVPLVSAQAWTCFEPRDNQ